MSTRRVTSAVVPEDRTVGQLFAELADEMGTLVRQETKLATRELTQKAELAGKQIGFIAVGMLLATVSLAVLVAALILGLASFIAPWAAALIVGVVVAIAAFALASKGLNALRKMDPRPHQTIQSIKEIQSWAHEQIR